MYSNAGSGIITATCFQQRSEPAVQTINGSPQSGQHRQEPQGPGAITSISRFSALDSDVT